MDENKMKALDVVLAQIEKTRKLYTTNSTRGETQ